jgi:hypothetical protein
VEVQSIDDAGVGRAEIGAFMARLNELPEHRIGPCDETPAAVLSSFEEIRPRVEEGFFVARLGGRLAGAFGFDADSDLGRAWLWGARDVLRRQQ